MVNSKIILWVKEGEKGNMVSNFRPITTDAETVTWRHINALARKGAPAMWAEMMQKKKPINKGLNSDWWDGSERL